MNEPTSAPRQVIRGTSPSPTSTATLVVRRRDAPETWHVSADIHDDSGTHVEHTSAT